MFAENDRQNARQHENRVPVSDALRKIEWQIRSPLPDDSPENLEHYRIVPAILQGLLAYLTRNISNPSIFRRIRVTIIEYSVERHWRQAELYSLLLSLLAFLVHHYFKHRKCEIKLNRWFFHFADWASEGTFANLFIRRLWVTSFKTFELRIKRSHCDVLGTKDTPVS
jgi:hypothetical protein